MLRNIFLLLLMLRFWSEQADIYFDVNLSASITAAFIFLAGTQFIAGFEPVDRDVKILFIAYGLIILSGLISLALNDLFYEASSFRQIFKYISYIAVIFVALNTLKTEEDVYRLFQVIVIGLSVSCVFLFIQYFLGVGFVDRGGIRPYGLSSHPSLFGLLLVISAFLIVIIHGNMKSKFPVHYVYSLLLVFIVALYLTKARTAWVAFIVVVLFALVLARRLRYLFVFFVLILLLSPLYIDRISELSNVLEFILAQDYMAIDQASVVSNSFEWRLLHWYRLVETGLQQPYFGYGPASTVSLNEFGSTAHNSFVEVFVEQGALGLIAFIALIASIANYLKSYVSCQDDTSRGLVVGLSVAVLLSMAFGQGVFNQTHNMQMLMLSLVVVRCLALFRNKKSSHSEV